MRLPRSARVAACLTLLFALAAAAAPAADPAPKWDPASTATPDDVTKLQALQDALKAAVEKCTPATVAIKYGASSGSGVIISEDGLVLTAAHVIRDYDPKHSGKGDPPPLPFTSGKRVTVMLPDGKEYEGKTLGINQKDKLVAGVWVMEGMDSGMIQLTGKGPNNGKWPFRPVVGKSSDVKKGQWVMALGHPDGPKVGRPPVARLGRVLANSSGFMRTDCTIVGGDSGGPLFDLNGNVIGIHSRMVWPFSLDRNVHVPIDDFKTDWDKLLAGEWIGKPEPKAEPKTAAATAYFGVVFPEDDTEDAWITDLEANGPADKAGLKPGDTITRFNTTQIKSVAQFRRAMATAKPNDVVKITARRGIETVTASVTLVKRG